MTSMRRRFLDGMSHLASSVTVVTTDGPAGRAGMTVSSMVPVSAGMAKPSLLICVNQEAFAAEAILKNGNFCVNLLRDDQARISECFAGRLADGPEDRFAIASWTVQATGAPRLVDPLTAFDCSVLSYNKVGTHFVIVGEVEDIFQNDAGSTLVYSMRRYAAIKQR